MNSEMLLCEIGPFLDEYGPSPGVSSTDVSACKDYLRGVDLLWKGGWKVFPVPPSKTELSEDKAFAPLEQVVQAIWKFAERQKKKKNKYEFKMVPHNHLDDSIGGGDHRMDACVLEETYKDKIPNNIIMMPFEMKIKWNKSNQIQVRCAPIHSVILLIDFIGSGAGCRRLSSYLVRGPSSHVHIWGEIGFIGPFYW